VPEPAVSALDDHEIDAAGPAPAHGLDETAPDGLRFELERVARRDPDLEQVVVLDEAEGKRRRHGQDDAAEMLVVLDLGLQRRLGRRPRQGGEEEKREREPRPRSSCPTLSQFLSCIQDGGGGGNRTRVRRHSARSIYMRILFDHLVRRRPKRKGTAKPALETFHSPGSGRTGLAILLVGVPQEPQART